MIKSINASQSSTKNNYPVLSKKKVNQQNQNSKKTASVVMPKLSNIKAYFAQNISFSGTPHQLPEHNIENFYDALRQWKMLQYADYSDVHDDKKHLSNKVIRKNNYSFLDQLDEPNKKLFIKYYKGITGFPDLTKVSKNMKRHFDNVVRKISNDFNEIYNTDDFNVLFYGHGPTCSVDLNKSFPGSDLDKAYILIKGDYVHDPYSSEEKLKYSNLGNEKIKNIVRGGLWKNTDQRIVSLNHKDTFPEVITMNEFINILDFLDKKAEILVEKYGKEIYTDLKNSDNTNPYRAAEFNIDIRKQMDYRENPYSKREVKNFAFTLEALRENPLMDMSKEPDPSLTKDQLVIFNRCKKSLFYELSNVCQMGAWKRKLASGYRKQKLINREEIERNFNQWSVENQYDLIKNIIKSSSEDQSPRYDRYFKNDDDIDLRYRPLIEALEEGEFPDD